MSAEWRLILDDAQDGSWNMAVDRAIQAACDDGEAPPTLRLYRWRVPTLTLGRFQSADPELLERCSRWDVGVVRRPTGGRGVLHDDEVTYSVIAGLSDGVPRGTSASYRYLCDGIVEAYRVLDVDAGLTARDRGERHRSACYLHATEADVSVGVAKLSGSAQVWRGGTCLQHGSFTRTRDMAREREVFDLDESQVAEMMRVTATLEDLCGELPDVESVTRAAVQGFAQGLGVELEPGDLTEGERERANALVAEFAVEGP